MSVIGSIAEGVSAIFGQIQDRVEGIVSTILNILRDIYNMISMFFVKLFGWMAENPRAAIHFFASMYCLMV